MTKNRLPINLNPDITSYVQHAYTTAIIDNNQLMSVYINEYKINDWFYSKCDFTLECREDLGSIILYDDHNRISTDFELNRICEQNDELIIRFKNVKIVDALTYLTVSLEKMTGSRVEKYELKNKEKPPFFVKINQYDINMNEELLKYEKHFYAFYRIIRSGNKIILSISMDGEYWEQLKEYYMECNDNDILLYVIHIYVGENIYLKWKYMNYIQLFYNPNDCNTVFLDYFMFPRKKFDASYNYMCNFLDTEYLDFDDYFELFPNQKDFIKWSIDKKYYVNMCVDEYYIEGRRAYQKEHYMHFNLFYGYDDSEKVFYALGYSQAGKVISTEIPYDNCHNYVFGSFVVRYKFNINPKEIKFKIKIVIKQIQEYLEGVNSSQSFYNFMANNSGYYGIHIFNQLKNDEKGRYLIVNDKRICFVLYEHCFIMKERLHYLMDHNFIVENSKAELLQKCNDMLNSAELLKNMVIKNSFTHMLEKRIFDLLDQLYQKEFEFYSFFLKHINGGK